RIILFRFICMCLVFCCVYSFLQLLVVHGLLLVALAGNAAAQATYLGFDRNDYPGDGNLKLLRQTFSYAGYWLNNPPGDRSNTWLGKRPALENAGFGFLVLFNGRTYK